MTFWTYVAQIVNFVIFVVILHYLLYRPVSRIMKQRKDEMEGDLRAAEQKLREAADIRAQAEKSARELEEKRDAILKEARDKADELRRDLLKGTEDLGRDRLNRFRRVMEQERTELLEKISAELRETIVKVAGEILADACEGLTARSIDRVKGLLDGMSSEDVEGAIKALEESENGVCIRSAVPLTDRERDGLKEILRGKLGGGEIALDVEVDPSLVAGLEVIIGHINLQAHWRDRIDEALGGFEGDTTAGGAKAD